MTTTVKSDYQSLGDYPLATHRLCNVTDLVAFSGIAALMETPRETLKIALFYLPGHARELYAIEHHDPFSGANVIAHGIVGDREGAVVVSSPIYKQHFRLEDGQCLEYERINLRTWAVFIKENSVWIEA